MTQTGNQQSMTIYRVLVQGVDKVPFWRRFTVVSTGLHHILDLVAERMSELGITKWGILAVDEKHSGLGHRPKNPGMIRDQKLPAPTRNEKSLLIRPWGCFASDTESTGSLGKIRPGYLRWDEPEQIYCQANLSAHELRKALESLMDVIEGPWRLVVEYDEGVEEEGMGRLYYADNRSNEDARGFLSRHGIWCLGDGFIGVGIASLDPFCEVFVDSHGELLIWWDHENEESLNKYLGNLGLVQMNENTLSFVSAHPHIHVEHELTGSIAERIEDLQQEWEFYEYREEIFEEDEDDF